MLLYEIQFTDNTVDSVDSTTPPHLQDGFWHVGQKIIQAGYVKQITYIEQQVEE